MVSVVLYLLFTFINLWFVSKRATIDRKSLFISAALQGYGYFILQLGVHGNHYFLIVPLFAIVCLTNYRYLKYYFALSVIFLMQDLIFYGLGRDFNDFIDHLTNRHLDWTTPVIALVNVVIFFWVCYKEIKIAMAPEGQF